MQEDPKYQTGDAAQPESQPSEVIISQDTLRQHRLPPGQVRTRKWPVLHATTVPNISADSWSITIDGLVKRPFRLNWEDYLQLPRVQVFADFHCVTRWSRLGNLWEGVSTSEIAQRAGINPDVQFVILSGYDGSWSANLPLVEFLASDALLCDHHEGEPLSADHGGPVRMIIPLLYAWKSAKWLKSITFVAEDQPGYWESQGYHNHGDPWVQNDLHAEGERFQNPSQPPEGYFQ